MFNQNISIHELRALSSNRIILPGEAEPEWLKRKVAEQHALAEARAERKRLAQPAPALPRLGQRLRLALSRR